MRFSLILSLLFSSLVAFAQKGTIKGVVKDAATGEELIGVNVVIEGTATGASTNIMGEFQFAVEPGTHTILVSYIGFVPERKEITLAAGETKVIDFAIAEDAVSLSEVVVEGKVDMGGEQILIAERKKSELMVQSIGAQELSKVAASDAAEGLQKVVGLSVQGNKYIIVRGMGDRYNIGTLNGFPVASPDPDKRVIPFDIFPTNVIQTLDVVKSFSPELYGDFSGAAINVVTQDYPNDPTLTLSMGVGGNTQATFKEFMMDPEYKNDVLGFDQTREMPSGVAATSFYNTNNLGELTDANTFSTSFNPERFNAPLNKSFGVTYGNFFGNGGQGLGVMASANFSDGYNYEYGSLRTLRANGSELIDFDFTDYTYSTTKSAIANLTYRFNSNSVIRLYNTYSHLSESVGSDAGGFHWDYSNSRGDLLTRRLFYQSSSLLANQLVGEHELNNRLKVNWGVSRSQAFSNEPDRRQLTYFDRGDDYIFNAVDRREQHRFFYELNDVDYSAKTGLTYVLKPGGDEEDESLMEVSAGVQGRYKTRDFSSRIFSYYTNNINAQNNSIDIDNPDQYFTIGKLENGIYDITEQTSVADTYDASLQVIAPYAEMKWQLIPNRLRAMVGLRTEIAEQQIDYKLQTDSEFTPRRNNTISGIEPLPSLGLKYNLSDDNILRMNVSRTISRPDFKEVAPFQYTARAYGFTEFGNENLENGSNYNADFRFEKFMERGSLFAIGAFGKYLDQPISRVMITGAVLQQTYANADQGMVTGLEVEYRKPLTFLGNAQLFEDLALAMNASVLYSNMKISKATLKEQGISSNQTTDEFSLVGASPYLVNADLSYNKYTEKLSAIASLSYNVYGRRLYSFGTQRSGNIYELPVHMLNLSADFTFGETQRWGIGLEAKNLLNPLVRYEQDILDDVDPSATSYNVVETKDINAYKRGISYSLKLKYNLLAR